MSLELQRALVVGAGTMGHGIAHVLAGAGVETILCDVDEARVAAGLEGIRRNLDKGVEKGKTTAEERAAILARLSRSTDLERSMSTVDLLIEAVPENLALKQDLFRRASGAGKDAAILATNTSSLPVTSIASAASHPERCIGLHFFNPAHILPLLEIVRAEQTSDATLEVCRGLAQAIGKTPITVRDSPGFASSRLGIALAMEAIRMVESEVASAEDIDTAMKLGYRHPMGPLELTDLVGLDVRLAIADYLHGELGESFRPPELLRRMVAEGRLGKKVGRGFYDWT